MYYRRFSDSGERVTGAGVLTFVWIYSRIRTQHGVSAGSDASGASSRQVELFRRHIMKRRMRSLLLCLLCLLVSCSRGGGDDGRETARKAARESARAQILAEISRYRFAPAEYAFPAEYAAAPVPPLSGEDGSVAVVLQRESYRNNEFTTSALTLCTSVFTFSPDGTLLREEPLPLNEKTSPVCGILTEDSFLFAAFQWGKGGGASFIRFDRSTGQIADEVSFREAGLGEKTVPSDMAKDGDGNLYLISDRQDTLISLNAEFGGAVLFKSRSPLSSLYAGADGAVYAVSASGNTVLIQRANRETGSFEEVRTLDLKPGENGELRVLGDMLYLPLSDGVYRVSLAEKNAEPEKLLDYTVSGILTQTSQDGYGQFRCALDAETFYFSEAVTDDFGIRRRLPRIWHRVGGEAADSCTVVQAAFACELEDSARTAFVLFNRTHEDIRIVPLDYGSLGNAMQEDYGSWKMMTDILNGVIFPDVVIDRQGVLSEGDFDASPAKQLTDKGMTADLGVFLDRDPEISRDNLFGCVKRAFSDGRGGLWGISPFFGIRMWLALPDALDGYAPDGRWTMGEFLDFLDGLPEGDVPSVWFTSEEFGAGLLSDLGSFYDMESGTCRFDSPEFLRWLEVMAALPDSVEYGRTSPFAKLRGDELLPLYRDGTLRLCSGYLSGFSSVLLLDRSLGTKDFRLVGNPSHLDTGASVDCDMIFMILGESTAQDAAWELIRYFFLDEGLNDGRMSLERSLSLPALKSAFDAQEDYYASISIRRYGDGSVAFYPDSETEDRSGRPYTEEPPDRELVARIRDWLEKEGTPILEKTPGAVTDIVNEELSALRAGHGTAEDCAAKIQSRVKLWLAERR